REIAVDEGRQMAAKPRTAPELHAVRDLVEREPEMEVVRRQLETALDLRDVRAHEIEQAVIVRRQEHVVLPEHLLGDVPEQDADLRAERLAPELRRGKLLVVQRTLRERLEEVL